MKTTADFETLYARAMVAQAKRDGHVGRLPPTTKETGGDAPESPYANRLRQLVGVDGESVTRAAKILGLSRSRVSQICSECGIRRAG